MGPQYSTTTSYTQFKYIGARVECLWFLTKNAPACGQAFMHKTGVCVRYIDDTTRINFGICRCCHQSMRDLCAPVNKSFMRTMTPVIRRRKISMERDVSVGWWRHKGNAGNASGISLCVQVVPKFHCMRLHA